MGNRIPSFKQHNTNAQYIFILDAFTVTSKQKNKRSFPQHFCLHISVLQPVSVHCGQMCWSSREELCDSPRPSFTLHFTHSPWDSDGDSSLDLPLPLSALPDFISRPHANITPPSQSMPTGATLIYHVYIHNFRLVPSTCILLIYSNFCFCIVIFCFHLNVFLFSFLFYFSLSLLLFYLLCFVFCFVFYAIHNSD